MKTLRQGGLLIALLVIVMGVVGQGCSSSSEKDEPVDPGKKGTVLEPGDPKFTGKKTGGAQPDMNVYPAPAGVKTGTEGGKK